MYLFDNPRGTWVFSKLQGLQYYFPENCRCNLKFYESENFSDSSVHRSFESRKFFFFPNPGCEMWKIKLRKIIGNLLKGSKVVHEWNGHLEIFICPQVIVNSRQYLLVRTGILQKTVVGCPWLKHQQVLSKNNIKNLYFPFTGRFFTFSLSEPIFVILKSTSPYTSKHLRCHLQFHHLDHRQ